MKICTKCKTEKPLTSFAIDKSRKDGHSCSCKDCRKKWDAEYKAKNADKVKSVQKKWREKNRQHLISRGEKRRLLSRAKCLISAARIRSVRRGLPFDLDQHIEEIQKIIDEKGCELTGLPFILGRGRGPLNPSLDRIDPGKGYVRSNVRVVCLALNQALGEWGEERLLPILRAYLERRP